MSNKDEIVARLLEIVGERWLYERDTEGAASYVARFGAAPLGVALPADVDELSTVVKAAAQGDFALWVLPNNTGNGGLIGAAERNVVLLDLSRLNKILDVNTKAGHALVEPGVSYQQLHDHLQANKLGLWVDCDRNGLNSISGSICARDYGYTPYGDHLMMQCGMEVMLADGSLVRTGMGALPKSNTWQLFKYGFGPYIDGLFTQSNLGIVTKIGLWLMPEPSAYHPFMVTLPKTTDLAAAVEIMRPMKINLIIGNTVMISSAQMDAAPYHSREEFLNGGAVDLPSLNDKLSLGPWNLYGALYGIPKNVELLWSMVEPALAGIEGSTIYTREQRPNDKVWENREKMMRGVPSQTMAGVNKWQGSATIELAVTAPLAGEDAMSVHQITSTVLSAHGFDYLSEFALAWRSLKNRIYLPFEHNDDVSLKAAEECARELVAKLAAEGYGVTHTSTGHLDIALGAYRHGGMAELRSRLKTALDPDGVLAPG